MRRDAWRFEYLPNGGGEVIEKLSAKIKEFGGEISFKSCVKRVEKDGDWIVHYEREGISRVDQVPDLCPRFRTHPQLNRSSRIVSKLRICSSRMDLRTR